MHSRVQFPSALLCAGSQPDHGPALPGVHGAEHVQAPIHLYLVVVLRSSDSQLKDYLVTSITQLSRDKEHVTAELQRQVDSL